MTNAATSVCVLAKPAVPSEVTAVSDHIHPPVLWLVCVGLFLLVLKRNWDQKLSSGVLLTFMTTHLFLFRFAVAVQSCMFALTFFKTWAWFSVLEAFGQIPYFLRETKMTSEPVSYSAMCLFQLRTHVLASVYGGVWKISH